MPLKPTLASAGMWHSNLGGGTLSKVAELPKKSSLSSLGHWGYGVTLNRCEF